MADRPLSNLVVRVSADISNFTRGMTNTDKAANQAATRLRRMSAISIAALAAAGAAALRFGAELNDIGQDVLETESKFRAVTGASEDMANTWIDSVASMAGATRSELQGMIANLSNVAQGAGFAEDAATGLATELTGLAGDLGSFNNIPVATVAKDITSALTGEREAMKKYGIVIKQTEVDQQALVMTGKTLTSELTEQDRVLASSAILWEKAGAAVGDMARTQGSAARQSEQLGGHLRQIKEDLGVIVSESVGKAFTTLLNEWASAGAEVSTGLVHITGEMGAFNTMLLAMSTDSGPLGAAALALLNVRTEAEQLGRSFGGKGGENLPEGVQKTSERLEELAEALTQQATPAVAAMNTQLDGFNREIVSALVPSMEWASTVDHMSGQAEIFVPKIKGMTAGTRALMTVTDTATASMDSLADAASSAISIFKSGGSFLSKIGSLIGLAAPLLGPLAPFAGIGAGLLQGFAGGGTIPAGGVGLVGEQGPEIISPSASTMVTPNGGGGGDIHITLVTESGQKLVDAVTQVQDRNADMRRIIRVPVSAMAV